MSSKKDFAEYVTKDLLREIDGITYRAMFGGFSVYKNGKVFCIIIDDQIYFKVGDSNREDYKKYNSHPFTYQNKGKEYTMSYWIVPDEILEEPDELKNWVEKALLNHKK